MNPNNDTINNDKITLSQKREPFVMVPISFFDSTKLSADEKMVYLVLRRYCLQKDNCFPGIKAIAKRTGYSESKVRRTLENLTKKKIIFIQHRYDDDHHGQRSNLYIVQNYDGMWQDDSWDEHDQLRQQILAVPDATDQDKADLIARMITPEIADILKQMGIHILGTSSKPKTESEPTTASDQSAVVDPKSDNVSNNIDTTVSNTNNNASAAKNQSKIGIYDLDFIEKYFLAELRTNNPGYFNEIDMIKDVLYDNLNRKNATMIAGELRSPEIIKSRLMKLDQRLIMYVIVKYAGVEEQINGDKKRYLLTMLYNAQTEYTADLINRI